MSRFFWVRHGPTHAKGMVGWSDLPADLSDQARIASLNAYLPDTALVVSSDLSRAAETASAICGSRRRLPDDPDLREIHFGNWELQIWNTIEDQDHLRSFWDRPGDIAPPGGESWNRLTARVDAAVERLLAAYPEQDLILVAHMGVILTQVQRALRIRAYDAFAHSVENFSVTELHLSRQGWTAQSINHHP